MKNPVGLCLLLIAGFLPTQPADPQPDFFKGKQIKIVVGFTAAGIIDLWPRLYPQYMGKDIPGNPALVVQNVAGGSSMIAANTPEPTACGIVSAADAQKFVGGPLDVKEFAKIPTANGPGTYDSICTYIAKGGNFENAVAASRLLDVTLHFLNSADEMKSIYEGSIDQYRQMAQAPDAPFIQIRFDRLLQRESWRQRRRLEETGFVAGDDEGSAEAHLEQIAVACGALTRSSLPMIGKVIDHAHIH